MALLAACSSRSTQTPDAAACVSNLQLTPIIVNGTSPGGSLDVFRYTYAAFVGGDCGDAYHVHFLPAAVDPVCASAPPVMEIDIVGPFSTTGTHRARALLITGTTSMTDEVTFEATQLDPPDALSPRIVGRFVSHDAAWSFDIAVDLTSQGSSYCL